MCSRVDPSDVVQEALAEAAASLSGYLRERTIPFYLWLRRLALDRLVKSYRWHVATKKRTVTREVDLGLSDGSVDVLATVAAAHESGPSERAAREGLRDRVRSALERLPERDREVLTLRYIEQLSAGEIALVTGKTQGAVAVRHLRALERLRALLGEGTL
jgi:RNA polymerase sigma-70 factor (ECF subfamily)